VQVCEKDWIFQESLFQSFWLTDGRSFTSETQTVSSNELNRASVEFFNELWFNNMNITEYIIHNRKQKLIRTLAREIESLTVSLKRKFESEKDSAKNILEIDMHVRVACCLVIFSLVYIIAIFITCQIFTLFVIFHRWND